MDESPASLRCPVCEHPLPPAAWEFVGTCRTCGVVYRVARINGENVAILHEPDSDDAGAPSAGRARSPGIIVLALAVAAVLTWFGGRPGLELGVVLVLIAAAFWSAVQPENTHSWVRWFVLQPRALGALGFGVAILVPLAAWHLWSVRRVPRRISAVVPVYPGAYDPEDGTGPLVLEPGVLAVQGDTAGARAALQRLKTSTTPAYLMHTHAAPEAVMAFYRDPAHHAGLDLVEDDSLLLILRGNGRDVDVSATDQGYGRGTLIVYMWGRRATER